MTGINLGVICRLMQFPKYGFISRVFCVGAFVCMLVGISYVCKKFALLCRLPYAQVTCKAVGTACIKYGISYYSFSLWVL